MNVWHDQNLERLRLAQPVQSCKAALETMWIFEDLLVPMWKWGQLEVKRLCSAQPPVLSPSFEDNIWNQVSFGGFPETCASLERLYPISITGGLVGNHCLTCAKWSRPCSLAAENWRAKVGRYWACGTGRCLTTFSGGPRGTSGGPVSSCELAWWCWKGKGWLMANSEKTAGLGAKPWKEASSWWGCLAWTWWGDIGSWPKWTNEWGEVAGVAGEGRGE